MPGNELITAIADKIDVGLVAIFFAVIALLMNLAPQKEMGFIIIFIQKLLIFLY